MDKDAKSTFAWTKIILLAPVYKPVIGGVAEYSFQLAKQLYKHEQLEFVLSPYKQSSELPVRLVLTSRDRAYGKVGEDQLLILKRFYNAIYRAWVFLSAFLDWIRFRNKRKSCLVLISSYYFDPGSTANLTWLRLFNYHYAVVLHGLDVIQHKNYAAARFERNLRKAEFLIFNSKATQQLLKEKFPKLQIPSIVLNPGIDPTELEALKSHSIEALEAEWAIKLSGMKLISCVAHLIKRKGLDTAIEAIGLISEEFPEVRLLIGGEGPESEALGEQVKALNLEGKIKLLGYLDDSRKASLFKYSQIFVMPTKSLGGSEFEGFGISFLEASFFGNVVIGGDHGGVPEAIQDGHSGYILDFDKPTAGQDLADLLRKLLTDEELLQRISKQGKQRVKEKYNWGNLSSDALNALNELKHS